LIPNYFHLSKISVFRNLGDGNFSDEIFYETGESPGQPEISDVNNDGYPDLLVGNGKDEDFSVFANNCNGTFAPQVRYFRGLNSRRPVLADVNNDSYPDAIVVEQGDKPDYYGFVNVLMNKGDGTFDDEPSMMLVSLYHDPEDMYIFQNGDTVKILLDFQTLTKPANVDIYFIMINSSGTIYSGMNWAEGLMPAANGLTLPADFELEKAELLKLTIPNEKPFIGDFGAYTFAMAIFESGSGKLISNIATDSFDVSGE
jgi:hypothetical protein